MTDGPKTLPLRIIAANEAAFDDVQAVFGTLGDPPRCQCQRFKLGSRESWRSVGTEALTARLAEQSNCGRPGASTTGLVAYLDGQPVGWCAVEPRTAYTGLARSFKVPWQGRSEDKADDGVWAVTCFVVRAGFRRRGISRALAVATVEFARDRGARAVEGYPMLTEPGKEIAWGELHVGSRNAFAAAGYREVSRPTPRRVVMRIDFGR